MSRTVTPHTMRAQMLMGRQVYDAAGKRLGRVYDLETGRVDDELCVTALLVGLRSWRTRFGWTRREHGRRVPWEQITSLTSRILVQRMENE